MSSGHHIQPNREFFDKPAGPESKAVIHDMFDDLQGMHRVEIMWCERIWAIAKITIPQTDSVYWEVGFDLKNGDQLHVRIIEFEGHTRRASFMLLADPECQSKVRRCIAGRILLTLDNYYRTPGEWSSEAWDLRRFLKENFK